MKHQRDDDEDERHTHTPVPFKQTKTVGCSIGSYTLQLSDGTVTFDAKLASRSQVLSNLDPATPVPVPQFCIGTASMLIALASSIAGNTSDMECTPAIFAKTVQLCDFLDMGEDMTSYLLHRHLESPSAHEDSLARLRQCHVHLPIFPRILLQNCDVFDSEQQAAQLVAKILAQSPHSLTYYELSQCDGIYSAKKQKHLGLRRFANAERHRRQQIRTAAVERTNSLRAVMRAELKGSALEKAMSGGDMLSNSQHAPPAATDSATDSEIISDMILKKLL